MQSSGKRKKTCWKRKRLGDRRRVGGRNSHTHTERERERERMRERESERQRERERERVSEAG